MSDLSDRMQESPCAVRRETGADVSATHHEYDWNAIPPTAPASTSGLAIAGGRNARPAMAQGAVILIGICRFCGFVVATDLPLPS